jgi:hypothetical protein
MGEPRPGIRRRDGRQCTCGRRVERLAGARLGGPSEGLDLCPAPRHRVQVRRVRRQAEQPRPLGCNGLLHAGGLGRRQIIRADDGALAKRGAQHLLHVGTEHVSVGRALNRHARLEPRAGEGPSPRHVLPVVLWGAAHSARAPRRSTIEARQREIAARRVNDRDAVPVDCRAQVTGVRARRLHAWGGPRRGVDQLFLYGSRRRRTARDSVGTLPRTSRCAATRSHSSARVRSFCSRMSRATKARAAASSG